MKRWRFVGSLGVVLSAACGCGSPPSDQEPWSPFAADLVFTSDRDGNPEIYLLRAGDSEWANLTRHPAQDNWPEWSPDGERIAFQSMRSGNLDIWVMNADGSDLRQLTDDPAHDYLPTWSPDGTHIVFASWRTSSGGTGPTVHHYVMNVDGSGVERFLEDSPGTSTAAMIAPDGHSILMSRKLDQQGADVCLVSPDGDLLRRLTEDPSHDGAPAFSPDGTKIAFYSDDGTVSSIRLADADGSNVKVLVAEGRNWYPRWSADGRWIVYTAALEGGDRDDLDLFAIPVDGSSAPLRLAGGPGRESEGRWRPVRK